MHPKALFWNIIVHKFVNPFLGGSDRKKQIYNDKRIAIQVLMQINDYAQQV